MSLKTLIVASGLVVGSIAPVTVDDLPISIAPLSCQPVVVLDPGHSGKDISDKDAATGLVDHDYPNQPEMSEVFEIAKSVATALKDLGYDVRLTKQTMTDSVSLRQRATIAKEAGAALAVSIHTDHTRSFKDFAQVYAQQLGSWRGGTATAPKARFANKEVASASQYFAKTFASERTKIEKHRVKVTAVSFTGRKGLEPGNIPEVQLFAGTGNKAVPWVYNEVGGIGLGPVQKKLYAEAIVEAIRICIPIPAQGTETRN